MKKLLIFIIFLLIFITSCVKIQDCGNDLECFKERSKNCLKTKVIVEEEKTVLRLTLRGIENNECKVSFKIEDVGDNIKEKYPKESYLVKGKTLNCKLPYNNTDFYKEITDVEDKIDEKCSGPLKELMKGPFKDVIKKELNKVIN